MCCRWLVGGAGVCAGVPRYSVPAGGPWCGARGVSDVASWTHTPASPWADDI